MFANTSINAVTFIALYYYMVPGAKIQPKTKPINEFKLPHYILFN